MLTRVVGAAQKQPVVYPRRRVDMAICPPGAVRRNPASRPHWRDWGWWFPHRRQLVGRRAKSADRPPLAAVGTTRSGLGIGRIARAQVVRQNRQAIIPEQALPSGTLGLPRILHRRRRCRPQQ